jgi:GntR family transcriptional repressor for pyruvate dehydrogenase complex
MASPAPHRRHEAVVRHVEAELDAGRLPVGGRLPGERALAEQLGVSRASVREGIRVLEAMGVVRTAVGSGPAAGATVTADAAAGITAALRLHQASRTLPVDEIVSTRSLLEAWSVRRAALRPDRDALAAAGSLLAEMDSVEWGAAAFHELDTGFHLALTRAAGNSVVTAIMTALRGSIDDYILAAVPLLADWPAMARRLRRQHRTILAAVEAGDGERAAWLVTAHIEGFHRATQQVARRAAHDAESATAAISPAKRPTSNTKFD